MASNTLPDLIIDGGMVTMSGARHNVALNASWEIDALCCAMLDVMKPEDFHQELLVRAFSARIQDLATAIMSALHDEAHETRLIFYDVMRKHLEPKEAEQS
jgi:hypothetical protein